MNFKILILLLYSLLLAQDYQVVVNIDCIKGYKTVWLKNVPIPKVESIAVFDGKTCFVKRVDYIYKNSTIVFVTSVEINPYKVRQPFKIRRKMKR